MGKGVTEMTTIFDMGPEGVKALSTWTKSFPCYFLDMRVKKRNMTFFKKVQFRVQNGIFLHEFAEKSTFSAKSIEKIIFHNGEDRGGGS